MHNLNKQWVLAAILFGSIAGPLPRIGHACTSFVQQSKEGTIFAANLDLLVPADGLVVVNRRGIAKENFRKDIHGKTTKWVSSYGSVALAVAGRGFPWGGMNEAGLVISGMEDMASEFPEPDERAPFDLGSSYCVPKVIAWA